MACLGLAPSQSHGASCLLLLVFRQAMTPVSRIRCSARCSSASAGPLLGSLSTGNSGPGSPFKCWVCPQRRAIYRGMRVV